LVFVKSSTFNWNQRRVEISFEDAFQQFYSVDIKDNVLEYELTDNNLRQGITVKLKVIDYATKSEKTNEIMIEPFDLIKGKNQFTIAYNGNKPYIIY
jgi:DNA-directed RNA polymerase subunit E'/Rpb7